MLNVVIGALLPVIVTLGLGVLAGWHRDENYEAAQSLNRMVLLYALPITLFCGTITIPRKELMSDWPLLVMLLAGTLIPYAFAFWVARSFFKRDLSASALQALAFGLPAVAFTGIPILTPLIKTETTVVIDFAGLTTSVIVLPMTLIILSYAQTSGKTDAHGSNSAQIEASMTTALRGAFLQPVVLSPAIAIVCVLFDLQLTGTFTNSFKLLGSTVGGISLFASGVILQAQSPGFSLPALTSTAGRLVLIPGLFLLGLHICGQSADLTKMVVLALALPAAPMQVILAARFKSSVEENSAVLLYSLVLCVPTLALFILLTQ